MADGEQLGQRVFMNLAMNAQDAMPDGGEVTVTTRKVNGYAEVAFSDTGTGMDEETRAKVFEPLFTTKSKGTGLGLAACQQIVYNHRGTIDVTSVPGQGLHLCCKTAHKPGSGLRESQMTDARPKVMVVDDDDGVRLTLEAIIEDEGYEVVGATDGYRALELAKDTPFALIFMDIRMPGMNGVETYREIKRVSPGAVVVMMTGFAVEELVEEALEEGAYAVIYKPYPMDQVMAIVEKVLKTTCVLVVDDRAADRETLLAILEDSGYAVFVASDGEQAISMSSEKHYDVVLMDIRMPGIDGFAAFKQISSIDPNVKVIFITGYELESPVREALLDGAYTVVTKPVEPEKLLSLVNSIAHGSPSG